MRNSERIRLFTLSLLLLGLLLITACSQDNSSGEGSLPVPPADATETAPSDAFILCTIYRPQQPGDDLRLKYVDGSPRRVEVNSGQVSGGKVNTSDLCRKAFTSVDVDTGREVSKWDQAGLKSIEYFPPEVNESRGWDKTN